MRPARALLPRHSLPAAPPGPPPPSTPSRSLPASWASRMPRARHAPPRTEGRAARSRHRDCSIPGGGVRADEEAYMASKVRINLANEQELLELPGLDSAQAAAIVRVRSQHGPIEREGAAPGGGAVGRSRGQHGPIEGGGALGRVLGRPIGEDVRTRVDFSPSAGTA